MSTEWGYVCQSHDPELESDHWFNHGQAKLREIFADREALFRVYELDYGLALANTDLYGPTCWLMMHRNCAVAVRNEYGDTEPIDVHGSAASPVDASLPLGVQPW